LKLYYILKDNKPIAEPDTTKWIRWMSDHHEDRILSKTYLYGTEIEISTVFLGIDHNFFGGPPILFETAVFNHKSGESEIERRYETYETAMEGHLEIAAQVIKDLEEKKSPIGSEGFNGA
jgi:hypothetical protein